MVLITKKKSCENASTLPVTKFAIHVQQPHWQEKLKNTTAKWLRFRNIKCAINKNKQLVGWTVEHSSFFLLDPDIDIEVQELVKWVTPPCLVFPTESINREDERRRATILHEMNEPTSVHVTQSVNRVSELSEAPITAIIPSLHHPFILSSISEILAHPKVCLYVV
jgi:hypothetical protein